MILHNGLQAINASTELTTLMRASYWLLKRKLSN